MSKKEEVIIPKDAIRFRVIANSNDLKDQQEKKKIAMYLLELGAVEQEVLEQQGLIRYLLMHFQTMEQHVLVEMKMLQEMIL